MTEQMTPANDPSVDESASTEENATPAGTVYNGEFRPDPNRPEQSEEEARRSADALACRMACSEAASAAPRRTWPRLDVATGGASSGGAE